MAEAAQAAGNMLQGIGAYEAGRYNQKVANVEAIEIERAGVSDAARVREAARMAIGDQVNAQGSNGFAMGTGSALDALSQSQVNAALDALNIRQQAAGRARAARISGKIARAQGDNALVAGMLGATSSAMGGRSDWAAARQGTSSGKQ